jgi:hypothetical protein
MLHLFSILNIATTNISMCVSTLRLELRARRNVSIYLKLIMLRTKKVLVKHLLEISIRGCISTAIQRFLREQGVLRRTNRLLSLIRHGPHLKRRVLQFFYCCVCIRYRGNVSTEPLPSNDRVIFTGPLPSNDKGNFTESFTNNDRGVHRQTDTHRHAHTHNTHRQQRDLISLFCFSKEGK